MHMIIFFMIAQVAFAVLVFVFGAVLLVEVAPMLAQEAVNATSGTPVAEIGQLVARGIHFIADLAQRFLDFIFALLNRFGINVDSIQQTIDHIEQEAEKADKPQKPKF